MTPSDKVQIIATTVLGVSGAISGNLGLQSCAYLPAVIIAIIDTAHNVHQQLQNVHQQLQRDLKNLIMDTCEALKETSKSSSNENFWNDVYYRLSFTLEEVQSSQELDSLLNRDNKSLEDIIFQSHQLTKGYTYGNNEYVHQFIKTFYKNMYQYPGIAVYILGDTLYNIMQNMQDMEERLNYIEDCSLYSHVKYPEEITISPSGNPNVYNDSRQDIEDKIIGRLLNNENILLYGCGGIGKTSIAKAIYKKIANKSIEETNINYIAWISYEDSLDISILKTVDTSNVQGNRRLFANQWIKEHPTMLIIIDNVDSYSLYKRDELLKGLDNRNLKVIMTSREKMDISYYPIEIKPLKPDQCRQLFYHYHTNCEKDDSILDDILNALSYHTITIELVAKIANVEDMSLKILRDNLKANGLNFCNITVENTTYDKLSDEKTLIEHIQIIFSISNCMKDEILFLRQFAIIPRQRVSLPDITKWFGTNSRTVKAVNNKGWIAQQDRMYDINTIISDAILAQSNYKEIYNDCRNFIDIIAKELYVKERGHEERLQNFIPYAINIIEKLSSYMNNANDINFLINFFNACTYIGKYNNVIEYRNIAKTVIGRVSGDGIEQARLNCVLGISYQRLAYFVEANEFYNSAKIFCSKNDMYEWEELVLRNNMATAKHRYGCFKKAQKKYASVLKHLNTLKCSTKDIDNKFKILSIDCNNNYSALLSELGRMSAIRYCYTAFKDCHGLEGRDFYNTNIYMNFSLITLEISGIEKNIDIMKFLNCYGFNGIFDLMKHVLTCRCNLNKNLISTATAQHNIAVLDFLLNDNVDSAISYTEQALKTRKDIYGNNHPSTVSSRINLGTFYMIQNKENVEAGVELYKELICDIKNLNNGELKKIKQVPHIIIANVNYFKLYNIDIQDLKALSSKYVCKSQIRCIHETYGSFKCCESGPNFIINKEVTNITIINK